jgi:predicted ATPase
VPLLLIGAARSEFQKSWPDCDHHGQINLSRLDSQQTRALVAATLGDSGVDEAIIEKLIARTDGVPFFVE